MHTHHRLKLAMVCALLLTAMGNSRAVTLFGSDTDMGIQYFASVSHVSGNLYDVLFTIDTSGYTGTQDAWLDWVNLKVSPQEPASVTNISIPSGWSYVGSSAGKVEFQSATVGGPGTPPDSTDIAIPVVGVRPVVTFSYRVDLTGTSLETHSWPYQARYIFANGTDRQGNPRYTQTIVSRTMSPSVIPEPASLILFGAGLFAPLALRRRKG